MIIRDNKLRFNIMSALSDSYMHRILQSTSISDRVVTDIVREQQLPYSTAYKKIARLVKWRLLVLYKSEMIDGKKVGYYKSTFRSIRVTYNGPLETEVEAEPNQDALEKLSMRFYDL